MSPIYITRKIRDQYCVGYYTRRGRWVQDCQHWSPSVAADWTVYMNGGETEWVNLGRTV